MSSWLARSYFSIYTGIAKSQKKCLTPLRLLHLWGGMDWRVGSLMVVVRMKARPDNNDNCTAIDFYRLQNKLTTTEYE